jgi:hypothetical protein
MSAVLIAQLLAAFGPSAITLIDQLITSIENNQPVTSAQWATLISGIQSSTAAIEMAKELQAAGISSTDPKYIALVKAASA